MSGVSHDSETAAHGQQVITAVTFIHAEFDGVKKLFMPRRARKKKFLPGVFELPGGHIDFGEDVKTGLKREIREELGMNVELGDLFAEFTYTNEVKGSHSVELVYFAKFTDPIDKIKLDPSDHSEHKWVAREEMDEVYSAQKGSDDPEYKIVAKGFAILEGRGYDTK